MRSVLAQVQDRVCLMEKINEAQRVLRACTCQNILSNTIEHAKSEIRRPEIGSGLMLRPRRGSVPNNTSDKTPVAANNLSDTIHLTGEPLDGPLAP